MIYDSFKKICASLFKEPRVEFLRIYFIKFHSGEINAFQWNTKEFYVYMTRCHSQKEVNTIKINFPVYWKGAKCRFLEQFFTRLPKISYRRGLHPRKSRKRDKKVERNAHNNPETQWYTHNYMTKVRISKVVPENFWEHLHTHTFYPYSLPFLSYWRLFLLLLSTQGLLY